MSQLFTLSGNLKLKPVWTEDFGGVAEVSDRAVIVDDVALSSETPELYSDGLWKDAIPLTTTPIEIDLLALDHKAFGGTGSLGFSSLLVVYFKNIGENDAAIMGSAADRWSGFSAGEVTLKPSSVFYVTAPGSGWPVAAGSSVVSLAAAAGETTLEILFVGVTA